MHSMSGKQTLERIPEPRFKLPFLGHLLYLKGDIIDSFLDLSTKLGPIFRLKLGPYNIVAVCSSDLVKEVCDDSRFEKKLGPLESSARKELLHESLILLSNEEPQQAIIKRILLPGFHSQIVKEAYFPSMVEIINRLILKFDNIQKSKEINLNDEISRAIFDIIGLCGFNVNFNTITSENPSPFTKSVDEIVKMAGSKMFVPDYINKLRFLINQKGEYHLSILNKYADKILQTRLKQNEAVKHQDFLSLMLDGVDKISGSKLDHDQIRYQIITILVAGHETTASAVNFALFAMLTHPNVLDKAYEEVDRVLGTDYNKPLTSQDFLKLTYINQIMKEALRLWPPVPVIERGPLEDTILGGKYFLKKDQIIWPLFVVAQRDTTVWGKDADLFNPDRFAPALDEKRDPCSFLPFGIGQRSCLGRHFAMFEAPIILGKILQRYRFHLRPNYKLVTEMNITYHPSTLWVTIEKRKPTT